MEKCLYSAVLYIHIFIIQIKLFKIEYLNRFLKTISVFPIQEHFDSTKIEKLNKNLGTNICKETAGWSHSAPSFEEKVNANIFVIYVTRLTIKPTPKSILMLPWNF